MIGELPETLEVGGVEYEINCDFRACLAILTAFGDNELANRDKAFVALDIIYGEENLAKITDYSEAYSKAVWFLNCGKDIAERTEENHQPPLVDWEQDEQLIFSGIAATVGRDIRMDAFCHYWSFVSYFLGMGECTFTAVKSIRYKLARHEKLEKWEQEYYRANREVVDIKRETEKREELFKQVFGTM